MLRNQERQVLAFDVQVDVPVEVGEPAQEAPVLERRDVRQLLQADERQPHADHAVARHRFEHEALDRRLEDHGAAQPRDARAAPRCV